MRYAVLFLILAAGLLLAAVNQAGWCWLIAWPACSALVIAGGYAGLGSRVFGKRPTGEHAPWALALHLPYLLMTSIVWHVERIVMPENAADEVAPGLWVGRRPYHHEIPAGVRWVIDLTAEFGVARRVRSGGRDYLCWPTLDGHVCDDRTFVEAARRIAALEGGVYIHCAQGHGRSAALAAAVLILRGLANDLNEAQRMLVAARPKIALKASQRRLLARVMPELQQP